MMELGKGKHPFRQKEGTDSNRQHDEEHAAEDREALSEIFSAEHVLLPHILIHKNSFCL